MTVDVVVVMSTVIIGGAMMYGLQNWIDDLKRRVRRRVVHLVVRPVVEAHSPLAVETVSASAD